MILHTPLQVAFLTGQSNPASCALSPVQTAFLEVLARDGLTTFALNFPYREGLHLHQPTPLLRACIENAALYFRSRRPVFAQVHRSDFIKLLDRSEHTCFLAGSCGLELLANAKLPLELWERLSVFAYGPVARRVPPCPQVLVQGRYDRLSRWYFPQVDHLVECGHLDYLDRPEVLQLCRGYLLQTARRIGAVREA